MTTTHTFAWKERWTDSHVYFVGGPFSQWYSSPFTAELPYCGAEGAEGLGPLRFSSCEQFMMAGKAYLFGDLLVLEAIMQETNPRKVKELGRQVRGFDQEIWNEHAIGIVEVGNYAKFTQNDGMRIHMLSSQNPRPRMLVEGAHYDRIWGVGLAWDDPRIEDTTNWRGTNWLGIALMRVRNRIVNEINAHYGTTPSVPTPMLP